MKKSIFVLPLICLFLISCSEKSDLKSFEAMNTFMTVKSCGKNAVKVNELIKNRIGDIENSISVTKENSDVFKINSGTAGRYEVSEDTIFLMEYTSAFYEKSEGILNPALYPVIKAWGFTTGNYRVPEQKEIDSLLKNTVFEKVDFNSDKNGNFVSVPEKMQLDFGAVGKGYAGDMAIKILRKNGIKSAILDLGGNVQALGKKPDGTDWNVGIKSPFTGNAVLAVKISDLSVITSGGYERYFTGDDGKKYIHIFDSKNGRPVQNDCASVTIVCKSGLYADCLSTTLFAMGKEKAYAFWKKYGDFDYILITEDNQLFYTAGLKDRLKVIGDFSKVSLLE